MGDILAVAVGVGDRVRKPEKMTSQPVLTVEESVEIAAAERGSRFRARVDALREALGEASDLSVRDIAAGPLRCSHHHDRSGGTARLGISSRACRLTRSQ